MTGTIVVGVDGSPASINALHWAVTRAKAEHRTLIAVEVRYPAHLLPGTSYAPAPYGTAPPRRNASTLHDTVTAVREAEPTAPRITELHRSGEPGVELARAAHGAEMLVLGYNPHGRTTEFLFGRVTNECLRHADVPVVLVPANGHRI
ncbi:universal stress protein [Actinophytocola sp. NPDC049390]|uniref:universal stress protein n=1 Tax=Actinophytocola sp. NPDC049390 TaxID=3363894 RepID=UPI00379D28E7